ncbi:hypothetical protein [Nocardia sp. NPDC050710]|uniref:hypothetical protein n=1 Tax=Nocardia sp. NPDC050710 TaxID=3157220 RepID=UPI0033F10F2C
MFEVGQLVRLGARGVPVFRVVEVAVDGDPDWVSVVPTAETALNNWPQRYRALLLVPADSD